MSAGNTAIVAIVAILVLVILVLFLFFGGFGLFSRDATIDVDISTPNDAVPAEPGGEDAPQNYYHYPFIQPAAG
jgi:hypothetical protein